MSDPVRLIPRWFTAVVVGALAVFAVSFLGLALTADGVLAPSAWVLFAFAGLMLVSAVSALARPRRRREPATDPAGVRTFVAPAGTVYPLVGAMVVLMAMALTFAYVAVTNVAALPSPGRVVLLVVAAVAALPDFVRLITGRLHRWRLEIGPETVRYRGYRTDVTYPWSKVHGARIQARGPAGVLIDVKGAGKDPVVPITAFAVPAEQLVEEIERAKASSRR